jgi:hypothetical protein|tara:strand:- start:2151 stop:2681 length:531 start_codon:yes stop_codon:yes gene_type:complete
MFKLIKICVPILFIVGCGMKPSIEDAKLSDRNFSLESFFEGETTAYGQFQDVLGNVSSRFLVEIKGSWDGSNLVLVEDFKYEDGSEEQRIWTLAKTGENQWVGSADGVIGPAEGKTAGDMFYWAYTIDLPTPSGDRRVSFKDYMWMLSEDRVLNKAYMSKWGIPLGEVTIIFEKKS